MEKVTISFDLPEDREAMELALKAGDLSLRLWELDQEMRKVTKYSQSLIGNEEASDDEIKLAEFVRNMLRDDE